MSKRTFVIGDVHGELQALKALVKSMCLAPHDELIFLGDIVDKGPQTRDTIDYLIDLSSQYKCTFIKGNHEEMMLAALADDATRMKDIWLTFGGRPTLESYDVNTIDDLKKTMPKSHLEFLDKMIDAHITKDHVFVHAAWDTKKPLDKQERRTLRYQFMNASQPDKTFKKQIICGHSSIVGGKPAKKQNILCIDTVEYGWLTAYEVNLKYFLQASRDCQTRTLKRPEKFDQKRHVPEQFRI
mgnify:CR=1 FL=1